MISRILKTALKGARMAPLFGGSRGSSPAQQATMICEGMATHTFAVLRAGSGQRLPSVVKTPSPSTEPPKPNLPSPSSVGSEWFHPAGLRQSRGYAATQAPETARNVEATDPNGDPDDRLPGMPDAHAAAVTYHNLWALQTVCGVTHLFFPEMVSVTLFAVQPMDPLVHMPLIQLMGIGYVAQCQSISALSGGASTNELHQTRYRRLNLGMMASAGALLAVRAVHADLLTPVGGILTVLQAGLTAYIPFKYYSMTKKDGFVPRDVAKLISSDLRELLQPVNARSVIYAALTTAFLGLTISYIVAPVSMLTSILQGASTPECIALGRGVGAALLVLPTWTVSLKEASPMQTLNLGLSIVGIGHFMLLLPLWDSPEAWPLLHTVATFWGSVGAIGLFRLCAPVNYYRGGNQ